MPNSTLPSIPLKRWIYIGGAFMASAAFWIATALGHHFATAGELSMAAFMLLLAAAGTCTILTGILISLHALQSWMSASLRAVQANFDRLSASQDRAFGTLATDLEQVTEKVARFDVWQIYTAGAADVRELGTER